MQYIHYIHHVIQLPHVTTNAVHTLYTPCNPITANCTSNAASMPYTPNTAHYNHPEAYTLYAPHTARYHYECGMQRHPAAIIAVI
ncbi:hypothetical protein FKM82_005694 [Ascaphus truei]